MKYLGLEVEGAGRPKAEGRRYRVACRGKEDRSLIRCILPFWRSSLRLDLVTSFSVGWLLSSVQCRVSPSPSVGLGFVGVKG